MKRQKTLYLYATGLLATTPLVASAAPYKQFAVCTPSGVTNFFSFQPWYVCLQEKYGEVAFKDINDIFLIIFPLVDSLIKAGALVAVGILFYMIIMMVTARGDSGKIKTAVEGMRDAVIGLIIVIISIAIVNFVSGLFTT